MSFSEGKKSALNNLEASARVGDLDMQVKPLLDLINSKPCYYTTSSCFGRIVLLEDQGGKGAARHVAKWHESVDAEEVIRCVSSDAGTLWFKYESPILHIVCKDVECANELLFILRECGFKRSGIQSVKDERVVVEALSTERVDAPLCEGGRRLTDDDYVRVLVAHASLKFEQGEKKIGRLVEKLAEL